MKRFFLAAAIAVSAAALANTKEEDYRNILVAVGQGGILTIQAGRFNCPEGTHRATLVLMEGTWIGCARVTAEGARILFEDGDVMDVPASALRRPTRALAPGERGA